MMRFQYNVDKAIAASAYIIQKGGGRFDVFALFKTPVFGKSNRARQIWAKHHGRQTGVVGQGAGRFGYVPPDSIEQPGEAGASIEMGPVHFGTTDPCVAPAKDA
jgi:hypothetical protein